MDAIKVAKTALKYGTGYAGFKAGADTMRDAARIPLSGIQWMLSLIQEIREEDRLDRDLARKLDGKARWKKMVSDYGLTTESVRKRYPIVIAVNYLLLTVIAVFAGYWVALDTTNFAVSVAHGVYMWMLSLMLFYNTYRGHIAYSQCVTNPFAFLGLILRNPLNLIVKPLPDDYKVVEA